MLNFYFPTSMSVPVARPNTPFKPCPNDPDPWFHDGDIVFFSNIDGLCFRVHSGILSKYSQVLRDMITRTRALAQTHDTNTLWVEGCLAMKVGDSGKEIQSLLQALYARPGPSLNVQDECGFGHLASLLRSANKYRINWLRNAAIAHLSQSWPYSLETFENVDNTVWRPHPAAFISLARDVQAFHLLPITFYRLGKLTQVELADALPIDHYPPVTLSRSQVARQLPRRDLARYLYYQERRRNAVYSFMRDFIDQFKPGSACQEKTSGDCAEAISRVTSQVRDPSIILMSGPFELYDQTLRFAEGDRGVCPVCRQLFSDAVKEWKVKLWDELPSWFGLPDWGGLKKMASIAGGQVQ